VDGLEREAVAAGADAQAAARFFGAARQDPRTLEADRRQGVFQMPFVDFARRLISADRMERGRRMAERHAATFAAVRETYGVSPGILLAFWALETDYGAVQGDFGTLSSLVTLAHDCRRPELFRPQVLAALELHERGGFPLDTTGAWAGEIGQVQLLPREILHRGVDADGDGAVSLKTSVPDALHTAGAVLSHLGWRAGEPWLQEVSVPGGLDWSQSGLQGRRPVSEWAAEGVAPRSGALREDLEAALIVPQGRGGPAFLAYPNFEVLFEWNESFVYVATAAYLATRLEGAPVFDAGSPEPGLDGARMTRLQERLAARGHDVGGIDGILGARTREAVRAEQARLGMPVDGWPTPALLEAL
jgi:lytic murein transglycosylase